RGGPANSHHRDQPPYRLANPLPSPLSLRERGNPGGASLTRATGRGAWGWEPGWVWRRRGRRGAGWPPGWGARRGGRGGRGWGGRTGPTALSRRIGSPILSPTHCSAARAGPRVRFAYPGYAGRVAWGWKPAWIWRRWRRRDAGWPRCWAARRAARWERRWRE